MSKENGWNKDKNGFSWDGIEVVSVERWSHKDGVCVIAKNGRTDESSGKLSADDTNFDFISDTRAEACEMAMEKVMAQVSMLEKSRGDLAKKMNDVLSRLSDARSVCRKLLFELESSK